MNTMKNENLTMFESSLKISKRVQIGSVASYPAKIEAQLSPKAEVY